jgi:hypothetical protein
MVERSAPLIFGQGPLSKALRAAAMAKAASAVVPAGHSPTTLPRWPGLSRVTVSPDCASTDLPSMSMR